jgi:hypothetical protein
MCIDPEKRYTATVSTSLGDLVVALDVNPIVVGPRGCVAVDALVETTSADL